MEALSPMHLLIFFAVVLLLFGGKKIPEMMRGLGEGIRSFKEGMSGTPAGQNTPPQQNPPATQEKK
jgi:sec-independent protein translocase protein TatA